MAKVQLNEHDNLWFLLIRSAHAIYVIFGSPVMVTHMVLILSCEFSVAIAKIVTWHVG